MSIESTEDFYSYSGRGVVEVGGISISGFDSIRPSYRKVLEERILQGTVMPEREGKCCPLDFDRLVMKDVEVIGKGPFDNTVDSIRYLLSKSSIPASILGETWDGTKRELFGTKLVYDESWKDGESYTDATKDYEESQTEASKKYSERVDEISDEYYSAYDELEERHAQEKDEDTQKRYDAYNERDDRLTEAYNSRRDRITEINGKELSEDYTAIDKQKELEEVEKAYQTQVYSIYKDYRLNPFGNGVGMERNTVKRNDELDVLNTNRDIRLHNASIDRNNAVSNAYDTYCDKVPEQKEKQVKQSVTDEYNSIFLKFKCSDAIWQKAGMVSAKIFSVGTQPKPLFPCNTATVRSEMSKWADIEGLKVQKINPSLSIESKITRYVHSERWDYEKEEIIATETEEELTGSDSLYYNKFIRPAYKTETEDGNEEYGPDLTDEITEKFSKLECRAIIRDLPIGAIKSVVSDVIIEAAIEQSSAKEEAKKIYHARVEWSKGDEFPQEERMEIEKDYVDALEKNDEDKVSELQDIYDDYFKRRQDLISAKDEAVKRIRDEANEKIKREREDMLSKVESLLQSENSKIVNETDGKSALIAELNTQVNSLREELAESIKSIEAYYKEKYSDIDSQFNDAIFGLIEEYEEKQDEIEDKYLEKREEIEDLYDEALSGLEEEKHSEPYETWELDVSEMMNSVMEPLEPKAGDEDNHRREVRVDISFSLQNFTVEIDWRFLTEYDFSEYYKIAKEEYQKTLKEIDLIS